MRVLVTGGAGYIGSHTVRRLLDSNFDVTVVDDLSNGHREAVDSRARFVQMNILETSRLTQLLRDDQVKAVVHFAGSIEVAESVKDPLKYYGNNCTASLSLLSAMREGRVEKIVFSSTAAVYGNPTHFPITEVQPRSPINPYGRSKLFTEQMIEDASNAYGIGYAILRYFNVAGAQPDGTIGEAHEPETHLIPRVIAAALENKAIGIFGNDYDTPDGTCIRDYVHVVDLAEAHVVALKQLTPGRGNVFNVGSEKGYSVSEVIGACREVTGIPIQTVLHARRPGDPDRLVADSQRIRALGWQPRYENLQAILQHAWNWHRTHPRGYKTERVIAAEPAEA